MSYEHILFEQRGRVGLVTLNRPDRLNAWSETMHREMREAIEHCNADPSVGAVVFTGAGRAYCAGADISGFKASVEAADAGRAPGRAGPAPSVRTTGRSSSSGCPSPPLSPSTAPPSASA